MKIADMDMCSGCGACVAICPKDAIRFEEDRYCRKTPRVIENQCISCGLCVKTCPINQNYLLPSKDSSICYALQAKTKEKIEGCASGGVATTIAAYIIENSGYVFGCAFNETLDLEYVECNIIEELELLKGSKYVQSNLLPCYSQIKRRLEEGRNVLVIGLPCQIAAVKGYLSKTYENLYLIDLVCHGTPPIQYLKEHMSGFFYENIKDIKFRERGKFVFSIIDKSGKNTYSVNSENDEYYQGFLSGINYRENCYKCPYATIKRGSDITIGDFWGLDKQTLIQSYEGAISLALVNTEKGEDLLKRVKEQFIYEKRYINEAISGNEQLKKPMCPDESDRKIFLKYYPRLGYDKAFRKTSLYQEKSLLKKFKFNFLKSSFGQKLRRMRHENNHQ